MSSKQWEFRILAALVLVIVLAGCSSPTPAPTAVPTANVQPTLNAVRTESARTVVANLTQSAPTATQVTPVTPTATAQPTATPAPTNPPPPPATATATYIPWTLTPTQSPWACVVTSFSPKLNASINKSDSFDASWTVKNTGTEKWIHSDIDVRYSTGTKLQKTVDGVDLKEDVASGASITVGIDMVAPSTAGTYTTTWVVSRGDQVICSMGLTIVVP